MHTLTSQQWRYFHSTQPCPVDSLLELLDGSEPPTEETRGGVLGSRPRDDWQQYAHDAACYQPPVRTTDTTSTKSFGRVSQELGENQLNQRAQLVLASPPPVERPPEQAHQSMQPISEALLERGSASPQLAPKRAEAESDDDSEDVLTSWRQLNAQIDVEDFAFQPHVR